MKKEMLTVNNIYKNDTVCQRKNALIKITEELIRRRNAYYGR